MPERATDEDLDLLEELGVDTAPAASGGRSAKEQRIIAGFEEIERFVDTHGKTPEHGESRDIFERIYAVRLDRMRESAECREVLKDLDSRGLLGAGEPASADLAKDEPSDEELLASLEVEASPTSGVPQLVHVRSRDEIKAAEEIAQRNLCQDFDQFKPIFEKAQRELATGERQTVKYKDNAGVIKGDLFILDGQKVMVANAKKEPTYLLADVEIIAVFKLANVNRKALEALLHKFFGSARLDLELKDRFGGQVEPREWFLVPLPVINEAIQKIKEGTLGDFRYDPETARLTLR